MPDILKSAQDPKLLPPSQAADPVLEDLNLPYSTRGGELPKEPEPIPIIPPPVPKKHSSKSLILAVLLFLLATLPLAVYFTSQQRQIADLRGHAYPDPCEDIQDNGDRIDCYRIRGTAPSVTKSPAGPTTTTTITTTQAPTGTGTGAAGSCYGLGGGANNQTERDCLANATGGTYTSGACRGLTVAQCAALGRPVYCSGSQEAAGSARSGEFLSCGGSSTGGCGQVDVFDSGNNLIGFVIDKSSCGGSPPTTTTSNPPSREIHIDTPPSDDTDDEPPGGTNSTATPTPTATATSTPTPLPVATCELIKLYDAAGTDITQSVRDGTKKLAIGEEVTIATSKGSATKARFRIQGIAEWAENDTSKTTATEYRLSIHIPSTLTQAQGTFEVEVFVNGVWK